MLLQTSTAATVLLVKDNRHHHRNKSVRLHYYFFHERDWLEDIFCADSVFVQDGVVVGTKRGK